MMSMTEPAADLLKRAREGDREAYDRLFALSSDRVLLYVRLRLGAALRAKVDSMDVLQEAYIEAVKALPAFEMRGTSAFGEWLCRIAENCIRGMADHFGAQKRRAPADSARASSVPMCAPSTGPATAAARQESRRKLEQAIETLEAEERDVLLRRYFQSRTLEEIAQETGCSPTSVRRILARALTRLGEALRSAVGGEHGLGQSG